MKCTSPTKDHSLRLVSLMRGGILIPSCNVERQKKLPRLDVEAEIQHPYLGEDVASLLG